MLDLRTWIAKSVMSFQPHTQTLSFPALELFYIGQLYYNFYVQFLELNAEHRNCSATLIDLKICPPFRVQISYNMISPRYTSEVVQIQSLTFDLSPRTWPFHSLCFLSSLICHTYEIQMITKNFPEKKS